jgi:hypothetical protein
MDMARAGEDVIVLRTFSKLYGMAGMAQARPHHGWDGAGHAGLPDRIRRGDAGAAPKRRAAAIAIPAA